MPRGSKIRSFRKASKPMPAARAISTPSTSEPVWYIHFSPGWCIRGRDPNSFIHASGACGVGGFRPMILRSAMACWIGEGGPGGAMTMPNPRRKVSRSRRLIGRLAGTVSSSGPLMSFNTWRFASSGRSRSTGSSSRSLPSSTRIMAAAAVIGSDMEAMRKMESRCSLADCRTSTWPVTSTSVSPLRWIRVTAPATSPLSTARRAAPWRRFSRAFDKPPFDMDHPSPG